MNMLKYIVAYEQIITILNHMIAEEATHLLIIISMSITAHKH